MKPKTTIFLIAVLAACVAFVAVRKAGWFKDDDKDERTDDYKLFASPPAAAVELTVTSAAGAEGKMVFRRAEGDEGPKWRLVEPVDAIAENFRVERVSDMFSGLKITRQVKADDEDASDNVTALDKPRWTIALTDVEGKSFTLAIGRDLPRIGSAVTSAYVRAGEAQEQRTFVVAEDFAEALQRPLSDFRGKSVMQINADSVLALTVSGPRSYELIRGDDWRLANPVGALADRQKVMALLQKFANLTTDEFVDDNPANMAVYGLDKPALAVTIEVMPLAALASSAADGNPSISTRMASDYYTLLLGRTSDKKVFASLSGQGQGQKSVFTLPESILTDLQPPLIDLRDKTVLPVPAIGVSRVELELPGGDAALVREDGGQESKWRMLFPLEGPAGSNAVRKLIADVCALKATDFMDTPGAVASGGLVNPVGQITFYLVGQDKPVTLLIGSRDWSGKNTYVMAAGAASVAAVATAALEAMMIAPANLWDPQLLKLNSDAGERVTSLAVRRAGEDAVKLAVGDEDEGEGEGEKWRLTAPLNADVATANLYRLLDRLENLTATKVVALGDKAPDQYADSLGKVTVDFTTETPAPATPATTKPVPVIKSYRVHVVKTGVSSYAWVEGSQTVAVGQFAAGFYDEVTASLVQQAATTTAEKPVISEP